LKSNILRKEEITFMTSLAPCPAHAGPENGHYNVEYFKWQSEIGRFGGWANLTKFSKYLRPEMRVLDFGCGGGYLLANIDCLERLGIEVSRTARIEAERQGIRVVGSAAAVRDGWADLIISNHALEHCRHPLRELQQLLTKVIRGGMAVFVVPCESIRYKRRVNDPNHHLYTWSPMSAANLFSEAGFEVLESKAYIHTWPPRFIPWLLRRGGRNLFEAGCRMYGALTYFGLSPAVTSQVRIVAQRPQDS
jgi:SAM-dependent methyltransferase